LFLLLWLRAIPFMPSTQNAFCAPRDRIAINDSTVSDQSILIDAICIGSHQDNYLKFYSNDIRDGPRLGLRELFLPGE
jgi:hypothetical protein